MMQQPLADQALLIIQVSRSHSDTPHSVGLSWTSDQSDTETSTSQQTDINAFGGVGTHYHSKRVTALDRAATGIGG